MSSEYCCTGMLKGRQSGAIVAHQEAELLAVRLAAEVTPLGLQPYLILRYCPSCGRSLDRLVGPSAEPAAPRRDLLVFPERR